MKIFFSVFFAIIAVVFVATFAYPIMYGGGYSLLTTPISFIAAAASCTASVLFYMEVEYDKGHAESRAFLKDFFDSQEYKDAVKKIKEEDIQ